MSFPLSFSVLFAFLFDSLLSSNRYCSCLAPGGMCQWGTQCISFRGAMCLRITHGTHSQGVRVVRARRRAQILGCVNEKHIVHCFQLVSKALQALWNREQASLLTQQNISKAPWMPYGMFFNHSVVPYFVSGHHVLKDHPGYWGPKSCNLHCQEGKVPAGPASAPALPKKTNNGPIGPATT